MPPRTPPPSPVEQSRPVDAVPPVQRRGIRQMIKNQLNVHLIIIGTAAIFGIMLLWIKYNIVDAQLFIITSAYYGIGLVCGLTFNEMVISLLFANFSHCLAKFSLLVSTQIISNLDEEDDYTKRTKHKLIMSLATQQKKRVQRPMNSLHCTSLEDLKKDIYDEALLPFLGEGCFGLTSTKRFQNLVFAPFT